jgi:hypothetical protein
LRFTDHGRRHYDQSRCQQSYLALCSSTTVSEHPGKEPTACRFSAPGYHRMGTHLQSFLHLLNSAPPSLSLASKGSLPSRTVSRTHAATGSSKDSRGGTDDNLATFIGSKATANSRSSLQTSNPSSSPLAAEPFCTRLECVGKWRHVPHGVRVKTHDPANDAVVRRSP